jgi:hypothetical protein
MAWAATFGTPAALQILCTHFRGQSRQCSPNSAAFVICPGKNRTAQPALVQFSGADQSAVGLAA